jgi:3-hydroxyisobutyrate dehydrogenase-like beta-hydroxyacid dehydrogenase
MKQLKVGFLHPGAMGISLAASAQNTGHLAYWVSEGRSRQTGERAAKFGLIDAHTLTELCEICTVVVSVCPPHAAEEVAGQVLACSFNGLYLDANAISPQRVSRIGQSLIAGGVTFVDGGIIGLPAWEPGKTWLYLSGKNAHDAASCFSRGPLETSVIGEEIGKASALKMCYAAYTKGTWALLSAILATAEVHGVRAELEEQWARSEPDLRPQGIQRIREITGKAWRFVGEMEEIAATFQGAGVPGGFHTAAADIYRGMAHFKDAAAKPSLEDVLNALIQRKTRSDD